MDTLKISDNLIEAGLSPKQARALTESIASTVDDRIATVENRVVTKADLADLESRLKWSIGAFIVIVGVGVVLAIKNILAAFKFFPG